MLDNIDRENLPQATVAPKKRTRISIIWIVPIFAAVVAIGVAVQRIRSQGPTITIIFKAAAGVEAGKTFIKYKDVNIGQVTAVQLASDYSKVEVTAKIAKSAEGLIVEDAKFWVVEPRVTLSGISGLGTYSRGITSVSRSARPLSGSAYSPDSRWRPSSPSVSRVGNSCSRPKASAH
jgi:paraquat-inducible protein B